MNDWEKHIDKLHRLDEGTKMKIMWIGVPVVMALVVWLWLSFSDFGMNRNAVAPETQESSRFEIFKNGFNASFEEIKKMINDAKENFFKTTSINIEIPKEEPAGNQATAEIKNVFESAASTTINNNL